jgi:hypothetical protein
VSFQPQQEPFRTVTQVAMAANIVEWWMNSFTI